MNSKILIVDDTYASRETLETLLQPQGYKLIMAENGLQALDLAAKTQPDLILLDVMMPGMDGFEVCRRLRATPGLAEVPIIIITALDDNSLLLEGLESGADDFVTKPFNRHELSARVRTITRLNRFRTMLEQRESLRTMAERLLTAHEEERAYVSGLLHDELGQMLTAELMDIRDLQSTPNVSPEKLFARLESLYAQTQEISTKIRNIAHELRPSVLDTLGLKSALQAHCSKFSNNSHLPVHTDIDDALDDLLPDVQKIIIYRTLQEALNNILKHAGATQAWVELSSEDGRVTLTIQDDGSGFPDGSTTGGIGITTMRERLSMVGGALQLRNGKNGGAILEATLPGRTNEIANIAGKK